MQGYVFSKPLPADEFVRSMAIFYGAEIIDLMPRSRGLAPAAIDPPAVSALSPALLARFRSARILNEDLHDESLPYHSDRKFPQSDHAAFVAEFELDT